MDSNPQPLQRTTPRPSQCPNCNATVHGPFCAECGQETDIGVLKLRDFSHEYLQNFVTLEGRLWRTLWMLITQPGQLTVEFIAGRRRRYVRPLPLYLSLSFALFLALTLMSVDLMGFDDVPVPGKGGIVQFGTTDAAQVKRQLTGPESNAFKIDLGKPAAPRDQEGNVLEAIPPLEEIQRNLDLPDWLKPASARYYESFQQWTQRWNADPRGQVARLKTVFMARLPYAIFLLIPLFALNTKLHYFRRRRLYAEHFLFALHLHAFAFMTLLAALLIGGDHGGILFLTWWIYTSAALRKMFGGRWWPQILKAITLMMTHGILLALVMAITLVLTLPAI